MIFQFYKKKMEISKSWHPDGLAEKARDRGGRPFRYSIKFQATGCPYVGKYQTIHDANALVSIHTALHFQMDNSGRNHKEPHHGYNDGA